MKYGLRWGEIVLLQISGSGRVRLAVRVTPQHLHYWWGKPPDVLAEVYEIDDRAAHLAATWDTREEAEQVAANLALAEISK